MMTRARKPAEPGDAVDNVETPALLIEMDALERNIRRMAEGARAAGITLRPHMKSHKCVAIALLQVASGAIGVCCQKVAEAEAMVAGGINDVYVTNQVIAPPKLARLAQLARHVRVALAFDSTEGVAAAAHAARVAGVVIDALVELDLGDERAGVSPGDAAIGLARMIAAADGLRFAGLQCYKSTAQHAPTAADRRRISLEAAAVGGATAVALARAGLACRVVSGGGTGSWRYEATSGVYTEIQPGSYVFMDAYYGRIAGEDGGPFAEFENALILLATVTSAAAPGRAMVDAGTKAVEFGYGGAPAVLGRNGVQYIKADDEHGRMRWPVGSGGLRIGDRVRLVPGNCDPTVNLHDWLVGVRNGQVEAVWPVDARGPGQ
jgi:D-serine deaminase-like pyridoxal phosphate-dependent protein